MNSLCQHLRTDRKQNLFTRKVDYLQNECYSKILETSYTGDALYQLPLSFSIVGVKTKKSINEDYVFDFDKYNEFLSGECNGVDPIADFIENDKSAYFVELLRGDMNLFINYEDRTVNFDTPEFKAAAEFVNSNRSIEYIDVKDFDDFFKDEWSIVKKTRSLSFLVRRITWMRLQELVKKLSSVALLVSPVMDQWQELRSLYLFQQIVHILKEHGHS